MTPLDATLADLAELEGKATPGPFKACSCGLCGLVWSKAIDDVICGPVAGGDTNVIDNAFHNARYIAAALNALPAILSDRARLVKERDGLLAVIDDVLAALYAATHDTQTHDLVDIGKRVAALAKERDEAMADYHRCAQAIGVMYEAEGHASHPGPIDAVEQHIREAVRHAGELQEALAARDTAIADLAKARAVVEAARLRAEDHDSQCPELRCDVGDGRSCTCGQSALIAALRALDDES